jgi:hypothetical protein
VVTVTSIWPTGDPSIRPQGRRSTFRFRPARKSLPNPIGVKSGRFRRAFSAKRGCRQRPDPSGPLPRSSARWACRSSPRWYAWLGRQEVHFAFRLRHRTLLTPGEYGGWNVYDVPGLKGRQCGKQRRHEWAQIRNVIAWCAQRDHAETSVPNSLLKLYGLIDGDEGVEPGLIDKRQQRSVRRPSPSHSLNRRHVVTR